MPVQRIVICTEGHLFRTTRVAGSVGDTGRASCPRCAQVVGVRIIDSRMLSQDALGEAWRHRGDGR